jgi:hypothetical protein
VACTGSRSHSQAAPTTNELIMNAEVAVERQILDESLTHWHVSVRGPASYPPSCGTLYAEI